MNLQGPFYRTYIQLQRVEHFYNWIFFSQKVDVQFFGGTSVYSLLRLLFLKVISFLLTLIDAGFLEVFFLEKWNLSYQIFFEMKI